MGYYEYSEYNEFNRFNNLDSIEAKIIEHLINSQSKYANQLWQLLKYSSRDALWQDSVSKADRIALVEGSIATEESSETKHKRIFCKPFTDDAVKDECSVLCLYLGSVVPTNASMSTVGVVVELATHNHVNMVAGDADSLAHPDTTNPNDYYYTDENVPVVQYKSRESVLLKSVLAELNGLYIDGVGYLQFNKQGATGTQAGAAQAVMSIYDGRSFFGHKILFTVQMAGVSENSTEGY